MERYLLAIETSSEQGSLVFVCLKGSEGKKKKKKKEHDLKHDLRGNFKDHLLGPEKEVFFHSFEVLSEKVWISNDRSFHSEQITLHLLDGLKEARLKLRDLNYLAISKGPGSFTGLRVGMNVIRTLAFSLNLPVFSVHSLRVLAQGLKGKKNLDEAQVITLVKAYKREYFSAFFEKKGDQIQEVLPPTLLSFEELLKKVKQIFKLDWKKDFKKVLKGEKNIFCLGTGFLDLRVKAHFSSIGKILIQGQGDLDYPLARHLSEVVFQDFSINAPLNWKTLKPLYIRASSAEEKLKEKIKEKGNGF